MGQNRGFSPTLFLQGVATVHTIYHPVATDYTPYFHDNLNSEVDAYYDFTKAMENREPPGMSRRKKKK